MRGKREAGAGTTRPPRSCVGAHPGGQVGARERRARPEDSAEFVARRRGRAELARDPGHRARWPAVTARAVASTSELVELAFPLLTEGGRLVAWKRGDLDTELIAARAAMGALGGGTIEIVDVAVPALAGHRLVVATRGDRPSDAFPRDPAARRRRPW